MGKSFQDQVDETFARSEAEAWARHLAQRGKPIYARSMTEAAVELRAAGIEPVYVEPVTGKTAVIDLNTAPLPLRAPEPSKPTKPPVEYYCGECGKIFSTTQYKRPGMAQMQRSRHTKAAHPRPPQE